MNIKHPTLKKKQPPQKQILNFKREKRIHEYYDAFYYIELKKWVKELPDSVTEIKEITTEQTINNFYWHIELMMRSDEFSQFDKKEILLSEDRQHLIKRNFMQLNHDDKIYYNKLWEWVYNKPLGEYEISSFVLEENREKFDNTIRHWISRNEFQVFKFYIELSNDYTKLLKKEYYTENAKIPTP